MDTNDLPFHPESIDEDIDQLLQAHDQQVIADQPESYLVHEMRDLYLDESLVLERAWQRLSQRVAPVSSASISNLSMPRKHDQEQKETYMIEGIDFPVRKKNFWRKRFSTIGAGLVAALIVASTIAILVMYHQQVQQTHSGSSQTGIGTVGTIGPTPTTSSAYVTALHSVKKLNLAHNGKVQWSYSFDQTDSPDQLSRAGNILFVTFTDTEQAKTLDGVLALNATTGQLLWQSTFDVPGVEKHLIQVVVDGSTLDVFTSKWNMMETPSAMLFALNEKTGATIASFPLPSDTMVIAASNNMVYCSGGSHLSAYSVKTGTRQWSLTPIAGQDTFQTPYLSNGIVNVVSYKLSGNSYEIYGIDASTGKKLWQQPIAGNPAAIVQSNNTIYVSIAGTPSISALAMQTGTHQWSQNVKGGNVDGTILSGNTLYVFSGKYTNAPDGKSKYTLNLALLNATSGQVTRYLSPNITTDGSSTNYSISDSVIYLYTLSAIGNSPAPSSFTGQFTAVTFQGKTLWSLALGKSANDTLLQ